MVSNRSFYKDAVRQDRIVQIEKNGRHEAGKDGKRLKMQVPEHNVSATNQATAALLIVFKCAIVVSTSRIFWA